MRTYVYVDGFNLYYGALKGTPFRWLDLKRLVVQLVPPTHNIERIKYFTARVSGAVDTDAPRRQKIYLNALKTIPEIELHFGSFLSKSIWRPILNLPVANQIIASPVHVTLPPGNHRVMAARPQTLIVGSYPQRRRPHGAAPLPPLPDAVLCEVHTMEEKGSDVNLAAHLLNDAWKNLFDAAVVISNDTDLVAPIKMVIQERQKIVFIVCPDRKRSASPKLIQVGTYTRHIRSGMLAQAQFPSPIPGTALHKPPTW